VRIGFRRTALAAATLGIAVTTMGSPTVGAAATSTAATTGRTITMTPYDNLSTEMASLRAGDTLLLAPGTYTVHIVQPVLHHGTSTAPITMRAADPAHEPVILGNLRMWGPTYWVLEYLRMRSIDPQTDTLDMIGGAYWKVLNSEIFGTRWTGGLTNVSIDTDSRTGTGSPRGFLFQGNCVHDAARDDATNTDHNIYVNFQGNSGTSGVINRNIIYGHPNGEGIKLGDGGLATTRGAWHVRVTHNTIAEGGRQILLTGDVRYNTIAGNLLEISTAPFHDNPRTTLVYVNKVGNSTNIAGVNYGFHASMFSWGQTMRLAPGNGLRPDPQFSSLGCSGFHPTYAKAMPYGRWGTGPWPVW